MADNEHPDNKLLNDLLNKARSKTLTPMSDPHWLDAPTYFGRWLVSVNGAEPYIWDVTETLVNAAGHKWCELPTPPPKPLSKSRTVELTAKVHRANTRQWCLDVMLDGDTLLRNVFGTKEPAIEMMKRYGIEPEVSDG